MPDAYCNHDVAAWHDREVCECGVPVLTDEQVRQLMVIRDQYLNEPDAPGSDEATDRDLDYFDQIMEALKASNDQCSFCGFPNGCDCTRAGKGGCELTGEGADTMCACCAIDDDAPSCCQENAGID